MAGEKLDVGKPSELSLGQVQTVGEGGVAAKKRPSKRRCTAAWRACRLAPALLAALPGGGALRPPPLRRACRQHRTLCLLPVLRPDDRVVVIWMTVATLGVLVGGWMLGCWRGVRQSSVGGWGGREGGRGGDATRECTWVRPQLPARWPPAPRGRAS
jgi:hypothetical protein